ILDCLFFAANWIREVLSIFSSELGEDVEITNLKRLKHVCDIQTTLEQLLPHAPTVYNPPCFDLNAKSSSKFQGKSGKGQTSKTQSSLKSQKTLNATTDPPVSPTLEKSQKSTKKKGTVVPTSKVNLSSQYYRPHLKELNKEVLCLLKYPLNCRKSEEQESVPGMEKYV
uniref:Uncharacterized protein n=1 Tax=Ciona savignyi TaxID=51511 RepID=H2ZNH8_CIOSA